MDEGLHDADGGEGEDARDGTGPAAPDPDDGDAPVSNGCETLAGLLLAIVWAMVLQGYLSALALARATSEYTEGPSSLDIIEYGALSSLSVDTSPVTFVIAPVLLIVAYVLAAVVGPGDLIGGAGVRVLQGVRITGLVVTLNALISVVAIGRRGDRFSVYGPPLPDGTSSVDGLTTFLDRLALCLPLVAGTATVLYVSWLANRLLTADDDGPTTTGDTTAPLPA